MLGDCSSESFVYVVFQNFKNAICYMSFVQLSVKIMYTVFQFDPLLED